MSLRDTRLLSADLPERVAGVWGVKIQRLAFELKERLEVLELSGYGLVGVEAYVGEVVSALLETWCDAGRRKVVEGWLRAIMNSIAVGVELVNFMGDAADYVAVSGPVSFLKFTQSEVEVFLMRDTQLREFDLPNEMNAIWSEEVRCGVGILKEQLLKLEGKAEYVAVATDSFVRKFLSCLAILYPDATCQSEVMGFLASLYESVNKANISAGGLDSPPNIHVMSGYVSFRRALHDTPLLETDLPVSLSLAWGEEVLKLYENLRTEMACLEAHNIERTSFYLNGNSAFVSKFMLLLITDTIGVEERTMLKRLMRSLIDSLLIGVPRIVAGGGGRLGSRRVTVPGYVSFRVYVK